MEKVTILRSNAVGNTVSRINELFAEGKIRTMVVSLITTDDELWNTWSGESTHLERLGMIECCKTDIEQSATCPFRAEE